MAASLPGELVELVESGVSILVATRDAQLRPECARGVGARVSADRETITVLLNEATAARTRANLEAGSSIAVTFSRTIDHRTFQVKGPVRAVRAGTADEQQLAHRYVVAFTEALYVVGMSRALTSRIRAEPCLAVELAIDDIFQQTPGPDAGKPMARP